MRTVKLDRPIAPKLKLLTICNVNIHHEPHNKLLEILKERRAHNVGLEGLTIRSCHVPTLEYKEEFEGLVGNIIWEDVTETEPDSDSDSETETEEEMDPVYDYYDIAYWI